MIRFVILAMALLMFVTVSVALLLAFLMVVGLAFAVGVPLWLMTTRWMRQRGMAGPIQNPIERLQNLYVEGKIDLFEFERRVAKYIAVER
jgi:hypothetical protein